MPGVWDTSHDHARDHTRGFGQKQSFHGYGPESIHRIERESSSHQSMNLAGLIDTGLLHLMGPLVNSVVDSGQSQAEGPSSHLVSISGPFSQESL